MYVVVCEGVTCSDEPVTVPTPLIESDVALDALHESVPLWPWVIDEGDAVKEEMVGTGTLVPFVTVMVTEPSKIPQLPQLVPVSSAVAV